MGVFASILASAIWSRDLAADSALSVRTSEDRTFCGDRQFCSMLRESEDMLKATSGVRLQVCDWQRRVFGSEKFSYHLINLRIQRGAFVHNKAAC